MQLYKFVANDFMVLSGLRYNHKIFDKYNLPFIKNIIIVNSDKDVIYNIKSKNFPYLSNIYGLNFRSKFDFYDYDYIYNEFYSNNKTNNNFIKKCFYDNTFNEFTFYTDYQKFYKYYDKTQFIKHINKEKLNYIEKIIYDTENKYDTIDTFGDKLKNNCHKHNQIIDI